MSSSYFESNQEPCRAGAFGDLDGPTRHAGWTGPVCRGGVRRRVWVRFAVAIVAVATGALIACAEKTSTGTHKSAAWVEPDGLTRDTLRDANGTFPLTAAAVAMLSLPFDTLDGSKHAVVHAQGGAKALYREESTEAWFTD